MLSRFAYPDIAIPPTKPQLCRTLSRMDTRHSCAEMVRMIAKVQRASTSVSHRAVQRQVLSCHLRHLTGRLPWLPMCFERAATHWALHFLLTVTTPSTARSGLAFRKSMSTLPLPSLIGAGSSLTVSGRLPWLSVFPWQRQSTSSLSHSSRSFAAWAYHNFPFGRYDHLEYFLLADQFGYPLETGLVLLQGAE